MRDPLPQLRLSLVVPTFNESQNVHELLCRLESALGDSGWEVIFVDDDSPDRTADIVRDIARNDHRVRCLLRIGRRGLASAVIEGMLAASADIIGVMDADLQHDEAILPIMIAEIEERGADVVVATRYKPGGGTGDWNEARKAISRVATAAGRIIIKQDLSDPMSGFFMLNRQALNTVVHKLSGVGFKILLDILASGNNHLRVLEVPYINSTRWAMASLAGVLVGAVWNYAVTRMYTWGRGR